MKKKNKLIIVIVLLLLLSFFVSKGNSFKLENYIKDLVLYPYSEVVVGKSFTKDNNFYETTLANKDKEIKELKDLLEISINSSYKVINATIINRNMEYFFDEVVINKGTKNGLKENMAVVNNQGLIGKITKVNHNNSTIKLVTSADIYNMLSVQIQVGDNYVYGILSDYDEFTNSFIIEGIDENINIEVGSLVSTTGLGNIYPSGIIIGKVVRIQKDNFDLAYILKVEPSVNFDNFHYVAVLDRENNG